MTTAAETRSHAAQLTRDTLIEMYRVMVRSRRVDERAWALHRQGKIAFHISAIGHEACQVAAAYAIQRGVDYVFPYYRDLTLALALGSSPLDFLLGAFGKATDPYSGGRQMPSHFSSRALNIISGSSSVATQIPHAAGAAFAIKYRIQRGLQSPDDATQPRLALTCIGEGSTSQGEWYEAMNWAGVHRLPFICLVQNNHYAISVPYDQQSALPNVADRAPMFGIPGVVFDGNDVLASYDAMREAVERAYRGEGATLVEAKTYRPVPHSSDDDDRSYRSREEVEAWKKKDPILRFGTLLMERGLLRQDDLSAIDAQARAEVDAALRDTLAAPDPAPEDALGAVYAPEDTP
jgi:2-oxoisovalerate dehydrogenase E1 component alpha subunit